MAVDWKEPALVNWLGTTGREKTVSSYKSAFSAYAEFTGLTSEQLIDEALEDAKRDIRQRKDVVKSRLLNFYH